MDTVPILERLREENKGAMLNYSAEVDESGALKIPALGDIASVASIGNSVLGVFDKLFGGNDNQRRELVELLSRAEVDESGALKLPSFGTLGNIASIGLTRPRILAPLFGGSSDNNQQQRRDFTDLLVREMISARSQARSLEDLD